MDFIGLFVVAYWIVECTGLLFLARPHVLESVGHRFVICIPFVVDLYEHGFCARLIDGFGFTATGESGDECRKGGDGETIVHDYAVAIEYDLS